MDKKEKIFLLGGHDLEMLEISKMLHGLPHIKVIDHKLLWGARLWSYHRELEQFADSEKYYIYGIELSEQDFYSTIPANYHAIDHHNECDSERSAIEQVAFMLGQSLSRFQRLVAANDKGYIPAMQQAGASEEEIAEIRRQDRVAQGVTDEDERQAEEAIKNKTVDDGLIIVKTTSARFSPICDRLFPCAELLIYSDNELTYYGQGKAVLAKHFEKEIMVGKMYHGGGENGYFGVAGMIYSSIELIKIKDIIIQIIKNE